MSFAWPWALLGLLALPALAAIYWLRQRARRRPVSSLLLWRDAPRSRAAGRRFERFEANRLFLLELLILTLLVLAAAGPRLAVGQARRPLVVVLDDSFSMRAGGSGSPQQAATEAFLRELDDGSHGAVTLVAAGERPEVLGEGTVLSAGRGDVTPGRRDVAAADGVAERLALWRASSPTARLEPAIALAAEIGGDRARILVLSDRAPVSPPSPGRLWWWAFGREQPNVALVSAMRGPGGRDDSTDTLQLELANYSSEAVLARLDVVIGEQEPEELARLDIASGEILRKRYWLPRGEEARVMLRGDDALDVDDRVILLPEHSRGVRVGLEIGDAELRQSIRDVLAASERAIFASDRAELVITDRGVGEGAPAAWQLRLITGEPAKPYLGPFVLDRGHPLTKGLDLEGAIWGAGQAPPAAGAPVITAGDVVLLADRELSDGRHALTLYWRPALSAVQRTPNWPILWWNLLEWRARSVPGVRAANLRLGGEASIGLAAAGGEAELELPDGSRRRLTARAGRLQVPSRQLGIHRLRHGGRVDRWAVNALAAEESDLRRAESGRWGGWSDDAAELREMRGVAWMLLLAAVAGLVLHMVWSGARR